MVSIISKGKVKHMTLLDGVAVIIIGWSVLSGLRTGLIAGVAKIMGTITGMAAAYYWYRPLVWYLDDNWALVPKAADFILEKLPLASIFGVTSGGFMGFSGGNTQASLLTDLAYQLASLVLEIIAFIVILLVVAKVVARVLKMISGIAGGTPLGVLDRLAGLLLGLARGVLIVFILALLTQPLATVNTLAHQESTEHSDDIKGKPKIMSYFNDTLEALDIYFSHWPGLIKR